MFRNVALFFALISAVNSFVITPSAPRAMCSHSPTAVSLMSAEESETLLTKANDCAEGECSLDEVADLIEVLKTQQKELYDRVETVKTTIKTLEKVNGADDREVDEVRETVRALFRVFQLGDKASNNDYPALTKPTGYPGEVGDGPTTAYDALPPKPMKKSSD